MSKARCQFTWLADRAMPEGPNLAESQECKLYAGHIGPHESVTGCKKLEKITDCIACGEKSPMGECPKSNRGCGHHCNHAWTHDECCWCGKEFGEEDE